MRMLRASGLPPICLLAALVAGAPPVRAQTSSTEQVVLGSGGYRLNFGVTWTCDDSPGGTQSAAGEVDLLDAHGTLVAEVTATASGTTPLVTVTGAGAVSAVTASILLSGAGGTPADGHLHAVWTITGPPPGTYSLRFWLFARSVPLRSLSTISTLSMDTGGGQSLGAPTPTPTPTPLPSPPAITLAAPAAATVFQAVPLSATAAAAPGGAALASVVTTVSADNGGTWATVALNAHPSSPSDTESLSYAFATAGAALLRSTVTDAAGRSASATQAVSVARASQPTVSISPTALSLIAGQGATFTASGGATGAYAWGGSASGSGPASAVTFPTQGTYSVTVLDAGNANYNPSPAASAVVSVAAPFFTLSAAASAGGTVAGGGSYPPNAQATAVAAASPGNAFAGWTGDVTLGGATISVLMNANKSIMAHFAPLQAQTISYVPPQAVTTRTPPFALLVSASSGLPVSLALNSGPVSLAGNVVTTSGATGGVSLTATQPGNAQYLPAPPLVITFPVGNPPPGVLLSDDGATTRRSDKATRATTYVSVPAQ